MPTACDIFAACCIALCLNLAQASPLLNFNLLPSNGAQSGPAGTSVGWGYSITNRSNDYLVPTAINSDPFDNGTPLALFDFPVIAPNSTVSEAFVADISGLYQLTWDNTAPIGFVNAGLFGLRVAVYDNAPLAAGKLLFTAEEAFTPYSAIVSTNPMPPTGKLPPPSTSALLLAGWTALACTTLSRRKEP